MPEQQQAGIAGFTVQADRALGRASVRSQRYLHVQVRANRVVAQAERAALHVAFALDRSGSMSGGKLELARQAVLDALNRLTGRDRFAVTAFDSHVTTVVPASSAEPDQVARAREQLAQVEPGGSTALHAGWTEACDLIAPPVSHARIARCLLITDGQANVGARDPVVLSSQAAERRRAGIQTSTLGIGDDFNEELLSAMARGGGGQFFYVADASQLANVLQREVGDALELAASEVVVELWPSPGVRLEVLNDFPSEWTGTHLRVALGDLTSEQLVDLSVEAMLPIGAIGDEVSVEVRLSDAEGPLELPVQVANWTLAEAEANDRQPRNLQVLRHVGDVWVAQARIEVVRLNRRGDFQRVRTRFNVLLDRLYRLGGDDPHFRALADEVARDRDRLSEWVEERFLKEAHMSGTSRSRSRDLSGGSRKVTVN